MIFFYKTCTSQVNWTKEQFMSLFKPDSIQFYEVNKPSFSAINNIAELGKDADVKRVVLGLLNRQNQLNYYLHVNLNKDIKAYLADTNYIKYKVEGFLKSRNLLLKKDSVFNDKSLFKKYTDSILQPYIDEGIKAINNYKGFIDRQAILLNAFMGYKESYDSLLKWYNNDYPYANKFDIMIGLARMGNKNALNEFGVFVNNIKEVNNLCLNKIFEKGFNPKKFIDESNKKKWVSISSGFLIEAQLMQIDKFTKYVNQPIATKYFLNVWRLKAITGTYDEYVEDSRIGMFGDIISAFFKQFPNDSIQKYYKNIFKNRVFNRNKINNLSFKKIEKYLFTEREISPIVNYMKRYVDKVKFEDRFQF